MHALELTICFFEMRADVTIPTNTILLFSFFFFGQVHVAEINRKARKKLLRLGLLLKRIQQKEILFQ